MKSLPSSDADPGKRIRSALVTGSSGGIGEATARRLAAKNIAVAVHGRRADSIRKIVDDIERAGGRAVSIIGDLAQQGMPEAVARQASESLGGIDLVVNNAAQLSFGALEEFSLNEIRQLFDVNVFAVMAINKALLPEMRKRGFGRIINVSSIVGWLPFPFVGLYAASKHAIEGYSETLDHEVRSFGVRVFTVQPGYTKTNINANAGMVEQPMPQYDVARSRVQKVIEQMIEHGENPDRVAQVIVRAALQRRPRAHYRVGLGPAAVRMLRSILPSGLFALGLRHHFQLDR